MSSENLYGQISGFYAVTTKVYCNCDGHELMKYEGIHFNPKPDNDPLHLYSWE